MQVCCGQVFSSFQFLLQMKGGFFLPPSNLCCSIGCHQPYEDLTKLGILRQIAYGFQKLQLHWKLRSKYMQVLFCSTAFLFPNHCCNQVNLKQNLRLRSCLPSYSAFTISGWLTTHNCNLISFLHKNAK